MERQSSRSRQLALAALHKKPVNPQPSKVACFLEISTVLLPLRVGVIGYAIVAGMKYSNFPTREEFCKDVGSGVLEGLYAAVEYARNEWQSFLVQHHEKLEFTGQSMSAGFIHSCITSFLGKNWQGDKAITISFKSNTFEFSLASKYVGRVKRHSPDDKISSYPTEGAEDFWSGPVALEGMEMYPITIGYYWDADTMTIGDPVITLRQSIDKAVWSYKLTAQEGFGRTRSIVLESLPAMPELDISGLVDNDSAKETA